jgi:hypothetical protein
MPCPWNSLFGKGRIYAQPSRNYEHGMTKESILEGQAGKTDGKKVGNLGVLENNT